MTSRFNREYSAELFAEPEQIFPLLCPVREYDWIPGWRCKMIYSQSGYAELGCVFKTSLMDGFGSEVWVVSDYEPAKRIAFVRIGSLRTTRYEVILTPGNGITVITWRQEITELSPDVDEKVVDVSKDDFAAFMGPLNKMLAYYLKTGKMFSPDAEDNVLAQIDGK